jgi:hypothetical protein
MARTSRFGPADRLQCGTHGGAGCDAVIDHDGHPSRDFSASSISQVFLAPAFDLQKLAVTDLCEFPLADAGEAHHIVIAHDVRICAIDHGAHGEFGLHRHADFADQDQVQGRVQRSRNFRSDRYPAAWQRQDDDLAAFEFPQG